MLKSSLLQLRALLLTQRTLRLLFRTAWLGLAGYLIGWGINDLYGSLPDARTWLALGLGLALPALFTLFRPLRLPHLTWNLDRRFELREQLSAAWQAAQQPEPTSIAALLLKDAENLLPAQHTRVLQRGWFLAREITALTVVLALLLTINLVTRNNTPYAPADSRSPLPLPALAEAPTYEDLFPSGIPGLTEPPTSTSSDPLPPDQAATLDNLLSDLGDALGQNPETAPAGQALQQGDLAGAANEIERLADQLDNLSPDTRDETQDALQNAANQARDAGQDDLADALQNAADGMDAPPSNNLQTAESLDDLAGELRRLEDQFAAMGQAGNQEPASEPSTTDQPMQNSSGGSAAGSGNGGEGQSEPLERLEGEGQTVEIQGDTPSTLLAPGEASGIPTSGGSNPVVFGNNGSGDTSPVDSLLTPYNFPWRWRDVVSKYFSPQ